MSLKRAKYFGLLLIPPLVWWSLRSAPLARVLETLGRLEVKHLLILLIVNFGVLTILSVRWKLFLRALGWPQSIIRLVFYKWAASGMSYYTPALQVGGESLAIFLLHKRRGLPASTALTSVGLDKMLEAGGRFIFLGAGTLLILYLGLFRHSHPELLVLLGILLVSVPFFLFYALLEGIHPVSAVVKRLPLRLRRSDRWRKISAVVGESETHVVEFCRNRPLELLAALLLSALAWLLMLLELKLILYFFGFNLDWLALAALLTAARLSFLIPVPAGIGALEAGQVLMMSALGMNPALGLAVSLVIRGRDILFSTSGILLGLILLGRERTAELSGEPADLQPQEGRVFETR